MKKSNFFKKIIFLNILAVVTICLCSCYSNENDSKTVEKNSTSATVSENDLLYKKIDSINELKLDKITKISAFVQDEEIFTDDKDIISDFCEIIKNITPNDNIETPTGENGTHYFGFTQIMAYSGNDLLYTFSLNSGKNNQTVYVDNNKSYFYCDINSDNAERFSEIYSKIYSISDNTSENE